jgi:hypothetical protein
VTILQPGTFRVSDYRKSIPNKVKLQVIARDHDFDHRPPLCDRPFDTELNDFVPPQNDPDHLFAILRADHDQHTFGRKPGAEKTVTTRGSDVGERARTRAIQASEAVHQAQLASKVGDYKGAAVILASARQKRQKRKIPSRPFANQKRQFSTRAKTFA